MICPNCGSLQASNAAACTVCGHKFDLLRKPSNAPLAKIKLNKWEIRLIIFWSLLFLIGLRLAFGLSGIFPIILIPAITIFGITQRKKWAYYITFGFCLLIFIFPLRGLIISNPHQMNPFALFIPLLIIIVPMLFFAWKAYKEIK